MQGPERIESAYGGFHTLTSAPRRLVNSASARCSAIVGSNAGIYVKNNIGSITNIARGATMVATLSMGAPASLGTVVMGPLAIACAAKLPSMIRNMTTIPCNRDSKSITKIVNWVNIVATIGLATSDALTALTTYSDYITAELTAMNSMTEGHVPAAALLNAFNHARRWAYNPSYQTGKVNDNLASMTCRIAGTIATICAVAGSGTATGGMFWIASGSCNLLSTYYWNRPATTK